MEDINFEMAIAKIPNVCRPSTTAKVYTSAGGVPDGGFLAHFNLTPDLVLMGPGRGRILVGDSKPASGGSLRYAFV